MGVFSDLVKIVASKLKSPPPLSMPNQFFYWYDSINRKSKQKQVLAKNPSGEQLRNFAKNSIVRRPISLIKDTISRLDYELVNVNGDDKKPYKKQKLVAQTVIDNPNVVHNRKSFISMILEDLIVLDAGVFEKAKCGNANRPLFLYPVDGNTVQFVVPYDYTDAYAARFAQQQPGKIAYFSANQMAYLQRNYFTDRPQGLSPILTAYNYIVYLLEASERANGVASNATADFLISLGSQFSPEKREEFVTYFNEEIEGTGKIPIVAGTDSVDTKQIRAINKDGLYQEWQEFLMTIIAVSFGLPPQKIGVVKSNDRSTAQDLDTIVMTELVKPYADIIEDAVNEHILAPLGFDKLFKFKFVYEDSQVDKTAKSTRITNEFVAGIISENYAKQMLGYPLSNSPYADLTGDERKAKINKDLGINGYGGLGDKKNNYDDKVTDNKLNKGGD